MKILYFDCKNGISGDMALNALAKLAGCKEQVKAAMKERFRTELESVCAHGIAQDDGCAQDGPGGCVQDESGRGGHNHEGHGNDSHAHAHSRGHSHVHAHNHGHGRSYGEVAAIIENSGFSSQAKKTAHNIYGHIAEAEAKVHGASLETVHFHEVGRDEAIQNALGIGMALEAIAPDAIYTSPICDGKGTIICSHGEIPVPVPAVMALRKKCSYAFQQADINMEMVTPSGLASLMGIGAMPDECGGLDVLQKAIGCLDGERLAEGDVFPEAGVPPQAVIGADAVALSEDGRPLDTSALRKMAVSSEAGCHVIAFAEAKGNRNTKRPGLRVYLIECGEKAFGAATRQMYSTDGLPDDAAARQMDAAPAVPAPKHAAPASAALHSAHEEDIH